MILVDTGYVNFLPSIESEIIKMGIKWLIYRVLSLLTMMTIILVLYIISSTKYRHNSELFAYLVLSLKREALTTLYSLSQTGDGCHKSFYFLRESPCLLRRRVVFFLFRKDFWNRYALIERETTISYMEYKNKAQISVLKRKL